ncbi:MAG: 2-amino-4-hydroxy-6-hydroxymethyldihydropteridine diphosphokinase, partial [Puniceicoccales bacterium]|nr:2-amino-4-hydroxy-6-hydroxymethyldihydropteridine diphosphokinase [Puniceicoccales bacterium]
MAVSDLVQNFHASFLSLGTNIENKEANLHRALSMLGKGGKVEVIKTSNFYQTAPQNFTKQEDFLNCACEIKTTLSPIFLLKFCKSLESKLGRQETFRYGPRLIDVDILLYDNLKISASKLTIPHPELTHRNFVLTPLNE